MFIKQKTYGRLCFIILALPFLLAASWESETQLLKESELIDPFGKTGAYVVTNDEGEVVFIRRGRSFEVHENSSYVHYSFINASFKTKNQRYLLMSQYDRFDGNVEYAYGFIENKKALHICVLSSDFKKVTTEKELKKLAVNTFMKEQYKQDECLNLGVVQAVTRAKAQLIISQFYKKSNSKNVISKKQSPLIILMDQAKRGDTKAQFELGAAYVMGQQGVKKDCSQAIKWYKKSASQNYIPAQLSMANFYRHGYCNIEADQKESADWFHLATNNGSLEAMHMLSTYYFSGVGRPQNNKIGFQWLLKSAEGDFSGAQVTLGQMYKLGSQGLLRDLGKARYWFERAAAQGHAMAKNELLFLEQKKRTVDNYKSRRNVPPTSKSNDCSDLWTATAAVGIAALAISLFSDDSSSDSTESTQQESECSRKLSSTLQYCSAKLDAMTCTSVDCKYILSCDGNWINPPQNCEIAFRFDGDFESYYCDPDSGERAKDKASVINQVCK